MADISITSTQVIQSAEAVVRYGVCGATINAGQVIYIDTANSNVLKLADADSSALTATVAGIALNGGATGQTIRYVVEDPALILGAGAGLTTGQVLYLSDNAGGITATYGDLETGDRVTVLGVVTNGATGTVNFKPLAAGAAIP